MTQPARSGAFHLACEPTAPDHLHSADLLVLEWHNDRDDSLLNALNGEVADAPAMSDEWRARSEPVVREIVEVHQVEGRDLFLSAPIGLEVETPWQATLVSRPLVRGIGVEGLTIRFPDTPYAGHLREKGYNGIEFRNVVDGWVRDVKVENADNGIFVNQCKRVTLDGVRLVGRKMHHAIALTWSSHCLCRNFDVAAPHHHGTTVGWGAHRNVFQAGQGLDLSMDAHRAAPFENLHQQITVVHSSNPLEPLRSGGSRSFGFHAGRSNVYWDIEHVFAPDTPEEVSFAGHQEWPKGVFVGWRGNREIRMRPFPRMGQIVACLGREPNAAGPSGELA